ncbi:MAG: putative drug exporter of the superfamily, partial [Solirubrobacteraceae bacterium]|nr:putative drug exporter of the superfamily [Solirubrobacteraceae bacterium]
IVKAVPQIRKAVKHPKTGLVASVTGPAGFAADLRDVFGGISGTLLISTALLVTLLLIAVYRSPVFWLIPLFSVVMAELMSRALGYLLANAGLTVTGESAGILSVLVFGAGTDYALLLIARFREELRREDDSHAAGISALRKAGPAIVASGGTVAAGLVCLVVAEVNGTAGLGPIGALGIVLAMASSLTLLPALLVIFGRRAFWPRVPIYGEAGSDETLGRWRRIGERLGQSPRRAWVTTVCALAVLPIGLTSLNSDLTSGDAFRNQVDAVAGQKLIAKAFAPGASAPATVIVGDTAHLDQVRGDLTRAPGVASLGATEKGGTAARFDLVLKDDPYSKKGINRIPALRKVAKNAGGPTTLIGGPTAQERDLRDSAARDNRVVPPLVFVVIFAVLALLLRAIVAPIMLMATVVLSYLAALGLATFVLMHVLGFAGLDPTLPLLAFIFLVALGVDYNIFLMARVREEALLRGTREGVLRGVAVTGGVITSAGVVLAGTFATLAVLPLVTLTEIGLTISLGVLLDTFIVRSLLVPALTLDLGRRTWWPSALSRRPEDVRAGLAASRLVQRPEAQAAPPA